MLLPAHPLFSLHGLGRLARAITPVHVARHAIIRRLQMTVLFRLNPASMLRPALPDHHLARSLFHSALSIRSFHSLLPFASSIRFFHSLFRFASSIRLFIRLPVTVSVQIIRQFLVDQQARRMSTGLARSAWRIGPTTPGRRRRAGSTPHPPVQEQARTHIEHSLREAARHGQRDEGTNAGAGRTVTAASCSTTRTTSRDCAPNAMRVDSSRRRRLTVYASVP